jgi:hypothetical protein
MGRVMTRYKDWNFVQLGYEFRLPNASKYFYKIESFTSPDAAKNLTANLSLDTLSRLHDTLISADEDALANLSQPPDELAVLAPHNLTQLITAQPNALRRLGQQSHLAQNGLAIPVLHAQP